MAQKNDIANAILKTIDSYTEANMTRNENDYVGSDGLLRCGICHEPKQKIARFDVGGGKIERIMSSMCKCDRERSEAARKEKERKEIENRKREMRSSSLMDSRFYEATFDKFVETDKNRRNLAFCKRYATAFDKMMEKNQGLLFYGDIGTGKSFAAACIANALIDRRISVVMTSFVKLIDLAKGSDEDTTLNRIANAKLVIFDDLGAERDTSFAIGKIYNIVDSRYRSNLPMIMTTNLSLDDMLNEQDVRYKRIFDRILEVCYPMEWKGVSWRKKAAKTRYAEMEKLLGGD